MGGRWRERRRCGKKMLLTRLWDRVQLMKVSFLRFAVDCLPRVLLLVRPAPIALWSALAAGFCRLHATTPGCHLPSPPITDNAPNRIRARSEHLSVMPLRAPLARSHLNHSFPNHVLRVLIDPRPSESRKRLSRAIRPRGSFAAIVPHSRLRDDDRIKEYIIHPNAIAQIQRFEELFIYLNRNPSAAPLRQLVET